MKKRNHQPELKKIKHLKNKIFTLEGKIKLHGELTKESEKKFKVIFQNSMDALILVNGKDGIIIESNHALEQMLGYKNKNLIGKNFSLLIPPEPRLSKLEALRKLKIYDSVLTQKFKRADGSLSLYDLTATLIPLGKREVILITLRDCAERIEEFKKAVHQAITDGLTGVYNRVFFENYLLQQIETAKRYNKKLSIVMADLDRFKKINDHYGHQIGDVVLKKVAEVIRTSMRKSDITARYGGDEFVLILPETDKVGCKIIVERIKDLVKKKEIIIKYKGVEKKLRTTISMGIAEYNNKETKIDLIQRADQALYDAKKKGKNSIIISL